MEPAWLIYKSSIIDGFPDYEKSIDAVVTIVEHPVTKRIKRESGGYIWHIDNDMILMTFNNDKIKRSHMSIKNFYIRRGENEFVQASRMQVLFGIDRICYARIVTDDNGFVIAALFGIQNRSALTAVGEIDILDMGEENKDE